MYYWHCIHRSHCPVFDTADPTIDNSAIVVWATAGDTVTSADAEAVCGTDVECLYDYNVSILSEQSLPLATS